MKLSIQNLSKTYPNGVQALKDLSLTIGTGMFGLLGPNGAGKSSLMRTIATLQEAIIKGIRAFRDEFEPRKGPPYATSHDLYRHLDAVTPSQYKYFLEDSWKKLPFYDNKIVSATSTDLGNGMFEVTVKVTAGKAYSSPQGKETKTEMNDFIDIGIFAAETKDKNGRRKTNPLYLKKHQLKSGEHTIVLKVKGQPVKAGIDPYNKLIDRIPDDNTVTL